MPGFRERFPAAKPLIGVIQLPALPGHAGSPGVAAVLAHALAELATYRVGGLDGVLVENENDLPHRADAARKTIAARGTEVAASTLREIGSFELSGRYTLPPS
jgi:predicted TIM-barrel enzyme